MDMLSKDAVLDQTLAELGIKSIVATKDANGWAITGTRTNGVRIAAHGATLTQAMTNLFLGRWS